MGYMTLKSFIRNKNGTFQLPFIVIVLCIIFFIYSFMFPPNKQAEYYVGDNFIEFFTPSASRMPSASLPSASRMPPRVSTTQTSVRAPSPISIQPKQNSQNIYNMNTIQNTKYDWDSSKSDTQHQLDRMKPIPGSSNPMEHKPYVEKNHPGEIWSNFLEGFNFQ